MKRIFVISILFFALFSCQKSNEVHLHGFLDGLTEKDNEIILRNKQEKQTIPLTQGAFDYKMPLEKEGIFDFFVNKNLKFSLYLKPGYDLKITASAKDFPASLHFEGKGEKTNNFLAGVNGKYKAFLKDRKSLLKKDEKEFQSAIKAFKSEMDKLTGQSGIEPFVLEKIKKSLQNTYRNLNAQYRAAHAKTYSLEPGEESPKFFNYEKHGGGTVSMDDLKGKYLYIDVWATWCGPCKREIPHMKKLIDEFQGKNIEFISISTDRPNAHGKWEKMVTDKGMKGLQLFMGNDKSFARDYNIRSIPRFIFIDPEGKIINANAPRPSQHAQVVKMFKEAGALL